MECMRLRLYTEVEPRYRSLRHSTSTGDWLVSGEAERGACYLVQTRNHYLTAVGGDVLHQIKPVALLGAGLENKARDGGALLFRKGPLQDDTRWARISWQRHGRLRSASPGRRICHTGGGEEERSDQLSSRRRSGGTFLTTALEIATVTDVQPWGREGEGWGRCSSPTNLQWAVQCSIKTNRLWRNFFCFLLQLLWA